MTTDRVLHTSVQLFRVAHHCLVQPQFSLVKPAKWQYIGAPPKSLLEATKESAAFEAAVRSNHKVLIAHTVLGCLAFALFAPTGAILISLKLTRIDLLKFHDYWQLAVWAIIA